MDHIITLLSGNLYYNIFVTDKWKKITNHFMNYDKKIKANRRKTIKLL